MERFVIEGGRALNGDVTPSGSKNEALPALAATLLAKGPVTLKNVPRIRDVEVMLEILQTLGSTVEWLESNVVCVDTTAVDTAEHLDWELCSKIRASILFVGPLLARTGCVELPPPGGDVIGRRRLDTHFLGMRELGASFEAGRTFKLMAPRGLQGSEIFLDEQSVTATENLIMAASLARGETTILNAASEPHVQGICRLVQSMGATVNGIGTNSIRIEGVENLHGCTHEIGPDYLEVGSFIALAAMTGGEVRIHGVVKEDLRMILRVFSKLGIDVQIEGDILTVPARQRMQVQADLQGSIPRIDDAPWPAFPTDLMSIAITAATQVDGTVLFFEKMFEGRMFFVDALISMGADIILCDPHRVVVAGASKLFGTRLESPDVRAGMALLMASLTAQGTSTIYNIRQIDRGYERIDEKLRGLGASIERLD
jgi:UDP-N-acetylglucosamine 1-carboxyvinyltransferase